ncbi:MAG: hypothetical protein HC906_10780 [Bacteroidales bacterium]|nr:hypothetical protein [Bacteroidales bacterium]
MKNRFTHSLILLIVFFFGQVHAQKVFVGIDTTKKEQVIYANGINLEGLHAGESGTPMEDRFKDILSALNCQIVRTGIPLKNGKKPMTMMIFGFRTRVPTTSIIVNLLF